MITSLSEDRSYLVKILADAQLRRLTESTNIDNSFSSANNDAVTKRFVEEIQLLFGTEQLPLNKARQILSAPSPHQRLEHYELCTHILNNIISPALQKDLIVGTVINYRPCLIKARHDDLCALLIEVSKWL